MSVYDASTGHVFHRHNRGIYEFDPIAATDDRLHDYDSTTELTTRLSRVRLEEGTSSVSGPTLVFAHFPFSFVDPQDYVEHPMVRR